MPSACCAASVNRQRCRRPVSADHRRRWRSARYCRMRRRTQADVTRSLGGVGTASSVGLPGNSGVDRQAMALSPRLHGAHSRVCLFNAKTSSALCAQSSAPVPASRLPVMTNIVACFFTESTIAPAFTTEHERRHERSSTPAESAPSEAAASTEQTVFILFATFAYVDHP